MSILVECAVKDLAHALTAATPSNRAHVIDVCIAYTKHTDATKAAVWLALSELLYRVCNENDLEIPVE